MTKRVLVPIATGFEEIEALTVVDILRRAGAEVVLAGVDSAGRVTGRSEVTVIPEVGLDEALEKGGYDLVYLPGGLPNAHIQRDDPRIIDAVKIQAAGGGVVAAICAAPAVLDRAALLEGKPHTCHPTIKEDLTPGDFKEDRVVVADNIITSRGAGTAMELAFTLVAKLFGEEKVAEVNEGVLAKLPESLD